MKKIDFMETLKLLGVIITAIVGSQAVNGTSRSTDDSRIAVLEEKVKNIETAMPEIITTLRALDKKTDSLIIISRMERK